MYLVIACSLSSCRPICGTDVGSADLASNHSAVGTDVYTPR